MLGETPNAETTEEVFDPLPERGPERRCLATGEVLAKERLLRFVVGPDGEIVPDPAARLPGRGLWLKPERAIIRRAQTRGLFARAAKAKVKVPDDLLERLVAMERRRLLDLLGLARRAGALVTGFEKVKAAIAGGRVAVLLEAAEAGDDGRGKLAALAAHRAPDALLCDGFTIAELSQALGREHAVHAAVLESGIAGRIKDAAARLAALAAESND
jgi:predicted RNA-binding protein YlxR (DUF448 family)